jgi:hypothetical protein
MGDRFAEVAAVADAVLFEGYLLYPYRASAQKNQVRWQWGVLVPRGYGADSGETSANRTECLVELRSDATVHVRVRYLHLERRRVLDEAGRPLHALDVGPARHVPFDEGLPRHVDGSFARAELLAGARLPIAEPGRETVDEHPGGRVVRTRLPLTATATLHATELPGPYDVLRLRVDVRNDAVADPGCTRDEALRRALIGTHLMLAADPGAFVSPTDPPHWAAGFVAECRSEHAWPVLAGPEDRSDLLLSAPIILADHPRLAPESTVDLFDGTENDEILTLRTMVLTDAEKAEARTTDPRAAAIIDAVDGLPPEILERLHGAIRSLDGRSPNGRSLGPADGVPTLRTPIGADAPGVAPHASTPWWDPGADASVDPDTDSVLVGGVPVAKGSAVVLRPGRSADAQDVFLAGLRATVQAVVHDVDGAVHVAVSLDGDPAAELQLAHGRFRYFRPDELEVPR